MLLNWYVGDGTAHKVKKVYLGVDGKARLVYNPVMINAQLNKSSISVTDLSEQRSNPKAVKTGDNAIIAGGFNGSNYSNTVDTFTSSLVKGTTTNLSYASSSNDNSYCSIGEYGIIPICTYRNSSNNNEYTSLVNIYNSSFTKSTSYLGNTKTSMGSISNGYYAMIGGGYIRSNNTSTTTNTVEVFTNNLVKSYTSNLSKTKNSIKGTTVGIYSIFGGGDSSDERYPYNVDIYNSSTLVKSSADNLSKGRHNHAACTTSNYAIFAGGSYYRSSYGYANNIESYSNTLVHSVVDNLSENKEILDGGSIGEIAVIPGGRNSKIVECVDNNLVHSTAVDMNSCRESFGILTIGEYLLISGGYYSTGGSYYSNHDVYTFSASYQ